MKVYVIHPREDVQDYELKVAAAEVALRENGNQVVNPMITTRRYTNELGYEIYGRKMEQCDAVFAMEGWAHSNTSNLEMANAMKLKKTITFE